MSRVLSRRGRQFAVEPDVSENLLDGQTFVGLGANQRAKQRTRFDRDGARNVRPASTDLGEQADERPVAERITAEEHRVENDAETPGVGAFARVILSVDDDFGTGVNRTGETRRDVIIGRTGGEENCVIETCEKKNMRSPCLKDQFA